MRSPMVTVVGALVVDVVGVVVGELVVELVVVGSGSVVFGDVAGVVVLVGFGGGVVVFLLIGISVDGSTLKGKSSLAESENEAHTLDIRKMSRELWSRAASSAS